MPRIAASAATTPHSGIRTMAELARSTPGCIRLEVGDPDFPTPAHISEASARAARDGLTHYAPPGGLPTLRELLVDKVRLRNGIATGVDGITVTVGGCGALFTTLLSILDPGDEVLLPDPGWPNYAPMVHVLGAIERRYVLHAEDGHEPRADDVEAAITSRTKAIVINSPANPTGAVYSRATIEALAELAERHGVWLISDECYDELAFDDDAVSPAAVNGSDAIVTIFSFSKTYAMTGWRVGYVVAPPLLAPVVARAQEPVYSSAPILSQYGAIAALTGPQADVAIMRSAYAGRRDVATGILADASIGHVRPRGAFYLMVDLPPGVASVPFAERLVREHGVAVVAGRAFGPASEGSVRVSLSASDGDVAEGVRRLAVAITHERDAAGARA